MINEVGIINTKVVEDILLKLTDVSIRLRAIVRLTTVTVIGNRDVGCGRVETVQLSIRGSQSRSKRREISKLKKLIDLLKIGVV